MIRRKLVSLIFVGLFLIVVTPVQLNSLNESELQDSGDDILRQVENSKYTIASTTAKFYPSHDASISSYYPNEALGVKTSSNDKYHLKTQSYTDAIYRSYLKFSLSTLPSDASISSAKIYMYLWTGSLISDPRPIAAHKVTSDSWSENTITWNNAPGFQSTPIYTRNVGSTGWYYWDVTSDAMGCFSGDKTFSECIRDTSDYSPPSFPYFYMKYFYSAEYSNSIYRPYLRVEYSVPPPLTVTLTADSTWYEHGDTGPTVTATANREASIEIFANGISLGQTTGTTLSCVAPFKLGYTDIEAVAIDGPSTASDEKLMWMQWTAPIGEEVSGADGARHPTDPVVRQVADKILQYGITQGYTNARTDQEEVIRSLCDFAFATFLLNQPGNTNNALSDYDVALRYLNYNPLTDDIEDYYEGDGFDCRDMAAFISGIARSYGIGARMISIEEGQFNDHVAAEIACPSTMGHDNWFLIDPRTPYTVTGDNTKAEIEAAYIASGGERHRFHIIYSISDDGWGAGTGEYDQETGWYTAYNAYIPLGSLIPIGKDHWDMMTQEERDMLNSCRWYADPAGIRPYTENPYGIYVS